MESDAIMVTTGMLVCGLVSFVIFVCGVVLTIRNRRGITGGGRRATDWLFLAAWTFAAAIVYDIGLAFASDLGLGVIPALASSIYHAIQLIGGEGSLVDGIAAPSVLSPTFLYILWGAILTINVPVFAAATVLSQLSRFLAEPFLRFRSWRSSWAGGSSYVILSQLDEATLELARSIRKNQPKTLVAFASVNDDSERDLEYAAKALGAFCLRRPVDEAWELCAHKWVPGVSNSVCTVILAGKTDEEDISMASRIKRDVKKAQDAGLKCPALVKIRTVVSLRGAETLLIPEETQITSKQKKAGAKEKRLLVTGVDLSRALVDDVIRRYPIFLVEPGRTWDENVMRKPATGQGGESEEAEPTPASAREDETYLRQLFSLDKRHVAVVGGGHLGLEFLCATLWASRIDGIQTRMDVIDREELDGSPGTVRSEVRFSAMAPEVMRLRTSVSDEGEYDLNFMLADAETRVFTTYLEDNAATLSYLFVATDDDMKNIKVAMHARQVLERELVRRCASRQEYLDAWRPVIVAVVEDDDMARIVEDATNDGQPYNIHCVGKGSGQLMYEAIFEIVDTKNEYKRQSSRASAIHAKYRLFAYMRNLFLGRRDIEPVDDETFMRYAREVDWGGDPKSDGCEIVERYNDYRDPKNRLTYPLERLSAEPCQEEEGLGDGATVGERTSREWLLRMEHDRWDAYIRSEGFEAASIDEVGRMFATGMSAEGRGNLHKSNLVGLHPCLVPFEVLEELDAPVDELYDELAPANKPKKCFQMLDDDYLGV